LNARRDIKIVFNDIDMPSSMDGLKLAAAVRDRWPPIEIIVTSGKFRPRETDMPTRGRFLSKPYDETKLIRALRELAH
jgi:two-component system, response regulator PdtaR